MKSQSYRVLAAKQEVSVEDKYGAHFSYKDLFSRLVQVQETSSRQIFKTLPVKAQSCNKKELLQNPMLRTMTSSRPKKTKKLRKAPPPPAAKLKLNAWKFKHTQSDGVLTQVYGVRPVRPRALTKRKTSNKLG